MNKEVTISAATASKIIKNYYEDYYSNMVQIKSKKRIENNDLYVSVKKHTKLNGKNIILKEELNEGQIKMIIKKYMEEKECYIQDIIFEPYFHNLFIRYTGNEFDIENKKGYQKILEAC